MNPRLKKLLLWVGYPAFYLLCFLVFTYLTFPFEHLRDRVVAGFAEDQRATGGSSKLEIDQLSPYWLSGVEATGVRLITASTPAADGSKRPPSELDVERIVARVSILPLLIGRINLHVSARALGGTIDADAQKRGDDRSIEADFTDLSIGRLTPLVELVGLPMTGTLTGHLELTLPEAKLGKASGTVRAKFADLSAGDGKTKIKETIALPKLNVGDLALECDVKDGVVRVTKWAAAGQDLDFSADGKLTLREPFAESSAELYIKFKFSDAYKNRNETTRSLFGTPGTNAPVLIEIAEPRLKTSRRPDGFYNWRASGLLRNLRFDPAPSGGAFPSMNLGTGPAAVRGFAKP
jgi:type II secretion system protein N